MKKDRIVKRKLNDLVFDQELYPRGGVDSGYVAELRERIENGALLPPPVIDVGGGAIIDGIHRFRAWLRAFGPDHEIDCVARRYGTKAEQIADAARLNLLHGKRLSAIDRARVRQRLQALGMPLKQIARLFQMNVATLSAVAEGRTAQVARPASEGGGSEEIVLKYGTSHLRGQTLTPDQAEVNKKLGGLSQEQYARDLLRLAELDMLDLDNERLVHLLRRLHEVLGTVLGAVGVT